MNNDYDLENSDDPKDEKIFDLNQEINRLRQQITYLQEELYVAEDKLDLVTARYELRITDLETQLGDALYGNK